ncbi:histidine phosphatase family protein [[Enterobacter] lignolyticus]|uniref:Phosphoglycerate mutase n=1 Tax=[Enterobacter] lignolyticus TaxID=1334193 RepID=A0A806XCF9_9ENTR|nr:histidine phosphatase family protein [[Enterobacter] lignolyticus]ALR76667.1 hypothetical protein AO703_10260 [[Enterobacter] lignolyticus]
MRIYLVRHGETQWNAAGRVQGQLDSPVTARGIQQIAALCRALENEEIGCVVTSTLGRATLAAAQIAARFNCPVREDARLIERSFGGGDGNLYDEDLLCYGEPVAEVSQRAIAALLDISRLTTGNVCVVTHGHVIQSVVARLADNRHENFPRYAHDNGAYSVLDVTDNALTLVKWGIATHLLRI